MGNDSELKIHNIVIWQNDLIFSAVVFLLIFVWGGKNLLIFWLKQKYII